MSYLSLFDVAIWFEFVSKKCYTCNGDEERQDQAQHRFGLGLAYEVLVLVLQPHVWPCLGLAARIL